jgi:hypothetical protein
MNEATKESNPAKTGRRPRRRRPGVLRRRKKDEKKAEKVRVNDFTEA